MKENTETHKAEDNQPQIFTSNPKYMTPAEDALLFRLKETKSLSWANIAAYFPNRKQASLQVRYYRSIKKRQDQKPDLSSDKLSVNNSTGSTDKTISGSSGRSHLSRAAKRKVQLQRTEPYSKLKSSRRFENSSGNNLISELAPTTIPQSADITSKNEKSISKKGKGKKIYSARKTKSTVTEDLNCNSNDKKSPGQESNSVQANSKKKRKLVGTDNQKNITESRKRPRLGAEEAQINYNSPKVPQSNIANDSLRNRRPVTRRMAEKYKGAASLNKDEDHKEATAVDSVMDTKAEPNKGRKTSNRNPSYPGSCSTGWVPVPPLSPSDPRYPGIIPKVFVYPPPTRIIEYHTGSGSFRIRTRRPSDDLRVGALVLQRGIPVYKPTDPRHKDYEGDTQKAESEAEKAATRMGESFKTTKVGVMSPIKEKGSDEDTSSDDEDD